ncbi:FAD-dependent oxidoreductase [Paraliobacillus sp. JSM ZJ581]|uniref:glycerol-3-phosphate dehydrogenase/oxidase n=1 Tax=Paraliobacillus sp. JSM ZJ581 TaxID=3342118 RepID=UPI0035A9AD8F
MAFSNVDRDKTTSFLSSERFDVLVIGGGITGASIALDAASRGMKTAVVDMQDFAAGTSSQPITLTDDGLHYLQYREAKVASEINRERAILCKNAPHVVKPENILLPIYQYGHLNKWHTGIGLTIYDRLTGVKKKKRHKMLSKLETLEKEPMLSKNQLVGAGYYIEYNIDHARLTIEVLKKAVQLGATALNYMKVVQFIYNEQGQVIGVETEDQITGENVTIYATKIVNATGPWHDVVKELDQSQQEKPLNLMKRLYLVIDQSKLPLKQALYFEHTDGRMILVIPKENKIHIETTDIPYNDDVANLVLEEADCLYLLDAINQAFPKVKLSINDVVSSWARVSTLYPARGKTANKSSNKDGITCTKSGLISVTGGKLTSYRNIAEKVIDRIARQFKKENGILYSSSETKSIAIAGGEVDGSIGFDRFKQQQLHQTDLPISHDKKALYIDRYGKNVEKIWVNYTKYYEEANHFQVDPLVFAELKYSLEEESIYMPLDFFDRRTGTVYFDSKAVMENGIGVLDFLSEQLYWNKEEIAYYKRELQLACQQIKR